MGRDRSRSVARRKARLRNRAEDVARRRAALERVLGLVGLREYRRRLDDEGLESWLGTALPAPRVVLDAVHAADSGLPEVAQQLQRIVDGVSIRVGPSMLTFPDFVTFGLPIHSLFRPEHCVDLAAGGRRRFAADCGRVQAFFEEHMPRMMGELEAAVVRHLATLARLDGPLYAARLVPPTPGRRPRWDIALRRVAPEVVRIEVGGAARRAYRCGAFHDLQVGGVHWVDWDAAALGLGPAGRLPVYLQSHAIRQAGERLGIKPEPLVHHTIWASLAEPALTPAPGGYLAEYRVAGHRLGHLVAERVGDAVLVRTFLLVTMRGTPEGEELSRRLRLRRPDIEHLELDRLGTLVATDLGLDPEIAGLLRDSGCGGALDLAPKVRAGTVLEGYAERFRRYTGQRLGGFSARYRTAPDV